MKLCENGVRAQTMIDIELSEREVELILDSLIEHNDQLHQLGSIFSSDCDEIEQLIVKLGRKAEEFK